VLCRGVPRSALALALVLLGGAALRAHGIERGLVWHDEVFTQVFAAGKGGEDWLPLFDGQVRPVAALREARRRDPERSLLDTATRLARDEPQHPPLYYVAARAAGAAVDQSDVTGAAVGLRWLTFLTSLLALGAMVWLARELFVDPRRRLLAVALFAVSPFHVLYAQEAREYALWTALVTATSAALLHARRRGSMAVHLGYGALLAVSFYVSFATASVALGHGLFVLAADLPERRWPAMGRATSGWAFALLLFAPWALLLGRHWEAYQASMAWAREITIPRTELLDVFALNVGRSFAELEADTVVGPMAAVVALAVALALRGAYALRTSPEPRARETLLLLAGLALGPVLLLLVPDLVSGGIRSLSARYLVPTWVALALLVAAAFPGGARAPRRARLPIGAALGALLVLGAITAFAAGAAVSPWTKGISRSLPAVAAAIPPGALLVGDHERHHPGTMLVLAGMLPDDVEVQLLGTVEAYELPDHPGPRYFLDPNPRFRADLAADAGVTWERVAGDEHAPLWRASLPVDHQ